MGKHGPCCHCGVTSTPLWRNGPPEKPILCNACGSRWRTKGTLENYTPLHARAEITDVFDDSGSGRVKTVSLKTKEVKYVPKRKLIDNEINFDSQQKRPFDDTNRSSISSAKSKPFSEIFEKFNVGDPTDLKDLARTVAWETKKRTCVGKPNVSSSVEMLTRDLCTILHEQRQSKQFSEEDLFFENVSVEMGHGSMLIQNPSSVSKDEESEASSVSVEKKLALSKRCKDKVQNETPKIHENPNLQLLHVDLNDIVNFDVFMHNLSHEEQQHLLNQLPSPDTTSLPNSLQSMFTSNQFEESIRSFKMLLGEGILDNSMEGVSVEDCRHLKKLALSDLLKSKWFEQYITLKGVKGKGRYVVDSSEVPKEKIDNITWKTEDNPSQHSGLMKKDQPKEGVLSESKLLIASPLDDSSNQMLGSFQIDDSSNQMLGSFQIDDSSNQMLGSFQIDDSSDQMFGSFQIDDSSEMLGSFKIDDSSQMPESSQMKYETSDDQDILLDVQFNNAFPEAELLFPPPNFGSKASTMKNIRF
ncbi:GATA transcription factor 27-like isoform X2 [Impatiens glandulifera]|uniref:GATA transcription factor 27-like isoform X2 n=1 Tax=Impatiens glandulifera TaxID=253017 RepID=UPI001FB0D0FD|nr:GATA transcription factor 27-like isoform X2 [Impatiens glandulifera]